jgi:hypothetical protein
MGVRVDGRLLRALDLSDFAVDPAHRSLGPALELLRATLDPVRSGEFDFCYDHPSESMLALYRRASIAPVAPIRRFVRPLSVTPVLERRWGRGLRSTVLGTAGDVLVRARDRLRARPDGFGVARLEGRCGEEFDELDGRLAKRSRVAGVRTAAHLNWRYLDHATWRHEMLCARRDGRLEGFAAFRAEPEHVLTVVDVCVAAPGAAHALARKLVAIGHEREASSIWSEALEGGPTARLLAELGFLAREAGPGLVVYSGGRPDLAFLGNPASWWMLNGDRDI